SLIITLLLQQPVFQTEQKTPPTTAFNLKQMTLIPVIRKLGVSLPKVMLKCRLLQAVHLHGALSKERQVRTVSPFASRIVVVEQTPMSTILRLIQIMKTP